MVENYVLSSLESSIIRLIMKKIPVILALVAVGLVAYSMSNWGGKDSIKASKNITTETREVRDFDRIDVSGAFSVDVTYGPEEKVEVEAPENLQKHISVKVKSHTLVIKQDENTSFRSPGKLEIHITTSKLNEFYLSGASSVSLKNTLEDNSLKLESSGAANFNGTILVSDADIELSGAAHARIEGSSQEARIELSGASSLTDYDFEMLDADVDLSGASSAKITCMKSLVGDVSGTSNLYYKGNVTHPKISESGVAKIVKR